MEKRMENIEDYEESEPYLEAKQYMDRLNQENEELLKKDTSQRDKDPTDLAEHALSLTVFPVTVPCASLSYATVQWDIPETPEPRSSQCHTGSGNKVDFSVGSEFDWTFSLSSTELGYIPNQEGIVDFLVETEQQPAVTLPNEMVSSQELYTKTHMGSSIEDCSAGLTSNEKKPHILVPPKQTSQSSYPGVEGPEIEKQTEEWNEKSIAETNGKSLNTGSLQEKITFLVQIKGPGKPLEQKETDLQSEHHTSNLEPKMNTEPAKTPVTVIEIKLNETLKHSEESGDLSDQLNQKDQPAHPVEPVSSEEKKKSDQMKETEKRPTRPEKPSEPPEAEMARRTSEIHPLKQTEHFMSSHEKQSSEQFMSPDEKRSSEQFMSPDEKRSSEQFMSLDDKESSEQFMSPDEKQSLEQLMSPEEKRSSEKFMSLDEKESSEQFMRPDEKQSSEQFMSPDEKRSSEQFMSLDEKESSEQFMRPDEKQSSEQFMSPDEKRSSEQIMSLDEKQSSEQFMSLDEKQSSEQCMSPDEKRSSEQFMSLDEKQSLEQFMSLEEKRSSEQFMSLVEKQSSEQFMSLEEKQSSEQFMSLEEKRSSEQFMSPEEKRSSEQFMSLDDKESSEQFISPDEKQSSEQFMSLDDKESSEKFMSLEEKRSSEQFMSPEEKRSSEQFMSLDDKESSEQFISLDDKESSEQFISPDEKQSSEQFMSLDDKESSEQFMSLDDKESSEQFISPDEKQSSEQFMSLDDKESSEQFMSLEEKRSSEQFMSPEEKQSSEQIMSPEEKQSSEQIMSPEEKQSSEQIMSPEEKQSSEQIMSPEEKECLDKEKCEPLQMKSLDPTEEPQCSGETGYLDDQKQHGVVTDEEVNHVPNDVMREGCVQETVRDTVCHHTDGSVKVLDRAEAQRLAERLYRLDGFKRTDVVRHLDKDNDFSHAVGEGYLKYFDFTNQSLEQALRSFLKVVVLIGETQERERVLQHFSCRFHQCNADTFSSSGAVLTLTCAVMLLNTDLHGQNVGKPMTLAEFISNLEGMNSGENFSKESLKSLYNSIKSDPLRWAIEDDVLAKSMTLEQGLDQDGSLRSKSNPFQDLPHNKRATVFQKGFLKRKAQADVDGKRTPWGKRSWKTFYAVLKGMVLYLQKDEYQMDWQSSEEVVSVHHGLAERAMNYTKKPHVFRLQTADWRVFLFEATSTEQMNSWIGRINLVSALYSSPPFPAAVGSQKKFCRPILPASQSNLTLDEQLESHTAMLENFQRDLSDIQQEAPDGRKNKARESEELRQREEYLQYEMSRYEVYVKILEAWQSLEKSQSTVEDKLNMFDEGLWRGEMNGEEEETEGLMKRSVSSPSLELDAPAQPVVKVRRNISERRTYRKIVIPRRNKEI